MSFPHLFNFLNTFLFLHKHLGTFLSDMENIATNDTGKRFTKAKITCSYLVHSGQQFGLWQHVIWEKATFQRNMKAVCSSETLIPTYQTAQCHNPEDVT